MFSFCRSTILHSLAVASLLAFSSVAHATVYYFGSLTNASSGYTAPDSFASDPFAQLKVTNEGGGTWKFKLNVGNNLTSDFGASAFIKLAFLDFNPNPAGPLVFTLVNTNVGGISSLSGQSVTSSTADFKTVFGSASDPLADNDWVTWTVSGLDPSSSLKAKNLSLVIGGIGQQNYMAQYGTTPYTPIVSAVPEPDTYAMLLAGLGLIAFTARRRNQSAAA